jgi:mono/diheme cytochrome c family protein
MVERFGLKERKQRHGSLLAVGLAAATVFAGCSDSSAPSAPGTGKDPISDSDDEEDQDQPKTTVKDAGKPKADAKAPTVVDQGNGGEEDTADAAVPSAGGSTDTLWCKAKVVLDKYCNSCHDGKGTGGAPMGLTTPEEFAAAAVVTKGKKVYEVVGTRIHDTKNPMPPKKMLTADEMADLDAFVAAKAPAGDNASCAGGASGDAGTPVAEQPWPPKECDATYKFLSHGSGGDSDPYPVPPGQEIHPQIYFDAPWGNEKVQMITSRPITDNPMVLHHWILYSGQGAFLTGWAPGDDERGLFPDDIGMNMPTGARALRLDMHYFNLMGTTTEKDLSGVEVCIVKGDHLRPKAAAVTMSFASFGPVLAPAGAVDKPITGTCNVTTTSPVHLMTASPHAHTMATRMVFKVKKKSGEEITMHDGRFQFGEQTSYELKPDVVIETGDVVTTTCYYTNPTTRNVTFGESTGSEMCFNFASYWPAGALSCGFGGLGGLGGFGGN